MSHAPVNGEPSTADPRCICHLNFVGPPLPTYPRTDHWTGCPVHDADDTVPGLGLITDDPTEADNIARSDAQAAAREIVTAARRRFHSDRVFHAQVEEAVHAILIDDRYDAEEYDIRRGAMVALHLATRGGA
jgi:hypothetical protein